MNDRTAHIHALFYWIEVALAPLVLWLLYRIAKAMWQAGWLGEDWPDPPVEQDDDEATGLTWTCPYCPRTVLVADDESELGAMVEAHEARIHVTGPGLVTR